MERISGTILEKIISSFMILTKIGQLFIGINSSGFKATHASQQIICTIKIRRAPTRYDSIGFRPLISKTSKILPLSVVIGDKAYDSEVNHVLVRDVFNSFSVIPARYEHVPIWRTHGRYRRQIKHGHSKILYHQRNHNFSYKKAIWRTYYYNKISENTEHTILTD